MYWWPNIKKEIANYNSKGLQYQQVKAKHQKPAGLLQSLPISEWKWEHMTMDFIVGLPRTPRDFQGSWEAHLPLAEFAYNNSFHSSIDMAPYEALYERKCRSPICWTEVGDRALYGSELVQETTEKIKIIQ
ncbi:uncharacterized protein LOC114269755 [Camellia sinensis]|uniref:uncharacterized protein LOC114269755 n=1 Tax=Camellia sinensis TaxID=4442 RepID=UPI00103656AE|nr:uncharacterized protein LOC114269755 [Camellia sinensis]